MGEERKKEIILEESESEEKYFFDSYAIIEILKGNPNYIPYQDFHILISQWNLAEIYYNSLLNLTSGNSDEIYLAYKGAVAEIDDETLKEAMRFRKKNKNKDLSYADAIGYIYAKRNNLKFLTGDKEFKDMENVEFVK